MRVAGITTNFTQGASQLTGRSTDMMIQGDGFFAVRKGAETYYTRDGSFDFDATGQMVLPGDGALVQGTADIVNVDATFSDVMVANPSIADVSAVQADKLYIVGTSVGTAVVGIVLFKEPATAARLVCLGLIVAGILGLKVFSPTA